MPLPTPKGQEKRSDFISRCISELSRLGEGKDMKQRSAICYSQWEKSKSSFTDAELEIIDRLLSLLG